MARRGLRQEVLTPHIVVRDAQRAADWYVGVLGATQHRRVRVPDGRYMQIELRFGDSTLMIADEFAEMDVFSPQSIGGTAVVMALHTDDADTLWERVVEAGVEVSLPLQEMFWGDRQGEFIDPFGHKWAVAQHVRDVSDEELQTAAAALFGGDGS